MSLRWLVIGLLTTLSLTGGGIAVWWYSHQETKLLSPIGELFGEKKPEKPLEKFTFDSLSRREFLGSEIKLERVLEESETFTSYLFTFSSDDKKISGLINIPKKIGNKKLPVIVMLRGYVDRGKYQTGVGTQRAGEVLAKSGFITLAPDFLGYGESDPPENDVWWERFNNPVVVLNLLASIKSLPQAEPEKVGIWAHSNGGQTALSVLEISRQPLPTTLWAPVSKPFPYSVLYYTDEFDDEGKALRAELSRLERDYDVRQFSITDYFERINAPLQIHQGTADEEVSLGWSDELVSKLRQLKKEVVYYVYPGADHNLVGSWETVVSRDVAFFKENLK